MSQLQRQRKWFCLNDAAQHEALARIKSSIMQLSLLLFSIRPSAAVTARGSLINEKTTEVTILLF